MTNAIPPYGQPLTAETVADAWGIKDGDRVRATFNGTLKGDYFYADDGIAIFNEGFLKARANEVEVLPPAAKPLTVGEVVLRDGQEYEVAAVRGKDVCLYTAWGLTASTIDFLSHKCGTPIAESE